MLICLNSKRLHYARASDLAYIAIIIIIALYRVIHYNIETQLMPSKSTNYECITVIIYTLIEWPFVWTLSTFVICSTSGTRHILTVCVSCVSVDRVQKTIIIRYYYRRVVYGRRLLFVTYTVTLY